MLIETYSNDIMCVMHQHFFFIFGPFWLLEMSHVSSDKDSAENIAHRSEMGIVCGFSLARRFGFGASCLGQGQFHSSCGQILLVETVGATGGMVDWVIDITSSSNELCTCKRDWEKPLTIYHYVGQNCSYF